MSQENVDNKAGLARHKSMLSSQTVVALDDMYDADGTVDVVYQAKARILNDAIQEIGMGRYQIYLFICAGFGWFA